MSHTILERKRFRYKASGNGIFPNCETAGHVDILKADVAWNVHHMEKLIVPIPLK